MADNFFKVKNGLNLPNYTGGSFPTLTSPSAGDMVFYNGALYKYNGTAWVVVPGSGTTGLITNADVDAAANIDGSKIVAASNTVPGVVSTGAQTLAGVKTFSSAPVIGDASGIAAASATVPGVVTTGVQTLAGTKTFSSNPTLSAMTTAGVVHNSAGTGALTSSLIVNADVDPAAAIVDTKLNTISTAGKVLNSATTATSSNTASAIVARDANGDFIARKVQVTDVLSTAGALNLGTSATDNVVVVGNLQVNGTTTTVNSTTLDVKDSNITINKGGNNATAAGAGLTVEGTGASTLATVQYDSTLTSKFKLGASGSEAEVVTVSDSQTLLNKSISSTAAITGALKIPVGTAAQQPVGVQGMIRYDTTASAFQGYDGTAWSSIGGATTVRRITQASPALSVGDVVYFDGTLYQKAIASTSATSEVVGMISRSLAGNVYELTIVGEVSGLSGLTIGENHFLSPTVAGAVTPTEPSVVGQVSLPVGVAISSSVLYFKALRGATVGGANVRTQITLANNATTNVQNVSAYEAGELTGWVTISATTPLRFFVRAAFARNGAASDYNLSYQTTGDTPPAGFSMGITAAGVITATLPSVTGYSTASINFALNAPAVGATLPLQISGGNVTGPVLGSTSGAAPAAGYVGEVISLGSANLFRQSNPVLNTDYPVTGLGGTISTPGVYMIVVSGFGEATLTSGAQAPLVTCSFTNSPIINGITVQRFSISNFAIYEYHSPISFTLIVRVTSSTTLSVIVRHDAYKSASPGTPSLIGFSGANAYAVRIA